VVEGDLAALVALREEAVVLEAGGPAAQ
jgi:hypothetical protein